MHRDTEVAEATDTAPDVKEPDPLLCEKNINIGDFYLKRKNYKAAIDRYLDAIAYQPDSARAFDSLARAYEKKNEPAKAIATYRKFISENPDSKFGSATVRHTRNFLDCVKSRNKNTACSMDVGFNSTLPTLLAVMSVRQKKMFAWDGKTSRPA